MIPVKKLTQLATTLADWHKTIPDNSERAAYLCKVESNLIFMGMRSRKASMTHR
jgi:hypothetical protein